MLEDRDAAVYLPGGRTVIRPPTTSVGAYSRLPEYHLDGRITAMRISIDAAGRIIVPKPLREALGIKPGQLLEIRAGDGRLEIEIAPTPMRLEKRGRGLVAVPDEELPALTADQVRETLERTRR